MECCRFFGVTTLCFQSGLLWVSAGQGAPLLPSARSAAARRPDASVVSSPRRGPACPGRAFSRAGLPWAPVSCIQTDLLSGSQLIGAAWGLEHSSVPLDTGQVGGRHSRQAREEPGPERLGLGSAAPGHSRVGTAAALPGHRPCFPSAWEQGPWRHLTRRVTGNQGHRPHRVSAIGGETLPLLAGRPQDHPVGESPL